jgi:hypothetical protein
MRYFAMRYILTYLDGCDVTRSIPVEQVDLALVLERLAMIGLLVVGVTPEPAH